MRRIIDAIEVFDEAEGLGYDARECGTYRWQCWMLLGNFERAWRESDAIPRTELDLWDCAPVTGKRIVVRCLHGYGDAIQFLRYMPLLRARAARVIVQIHPEMMDLARRVKDVDEVRSWADPPRRDEWDQQIEVTELPRVFRTTLGTIPAGTPYVDVEMRHQNNFPKTGRRRVGLLWASSAWNPARCMQFRELAPLLEVDGCDFYSFQRGEARAELCSGIHDTACHSPEIIDTAADLMNIDLLITVDTMAAHLAGALGRPVWVMLPFEADWRWMLDREDSPWYPSMRLFRQEQPGEWGSVVRRVADNCRRRISLGCWTGELRVVGRLPVYQR